MNFSFQNLTQINGGLSRKKIFRNFKKNNNKIIIDFSDNKTDFHDFLDIYEILKNINISIPRIYEVYLEKKIVVMEDFGDKLFNKIFNEKNLYYLLKLAVDNLIIIQNSVHKDNLLKLKKYTFHNLKNEISELEHYYIPYKNISNFPTENFYDLWESLYKKQNFIFNSFTHKDYEFINLILVSKNNFHLKCGIIDFQSAFLGFKGWDLFSLLENPRVDFTRKYNEDLLKYFYESTSNECDFHTFRSHYYILNLSRQSRLLGRWIKIYKEGNKKFLDYIVPTKKRIISCLVNIKDNKLKEIYERYIIND